MEETRGEVGAHAVVAGEESSWSSRDEFCPVAIERRPRPLRLSQSMPWPCCRRAPTPLSPSADAAVAERRSRRCRAPPPSPPPHRRPPPPDTTNALDPLFGKSIKKRNCFNQKTVAIHVGGPVKVCEKALKHKVTVRVKPEAVTENSADTDENLKRASVGKEISSRGSSLRKKKSPSLTSVLTARSKVACGITDKPKELIPDIDAADHNDQLAVTDYVEGIYSFYKLAESSNMPRDYMDSQVEINAKMRSILADWLIEVHQKFELMPETLYLTFYVIDCYLSVQPVIRKELQLVGISAMLIACKYEEIWAPEVNDFICISDRAYTREQILAMEKAILNKLEWNLTVPTPYVFLVRFLKAALGDKEMEHMTFFYVELGLMQYPTVMYCPSLIAAAAVYAARCTLKKSSLWTETLKRHSGYSESKLLECAQLMLNSHSAAPESRLKVAYKKYSSDRFEAVALHSPPSKVLHELKVTSAN